MRAIRLHLTDSTEDVDTAATVATNVQNLKTALENYNKALADYKKKYADLVDRVADEEHLNVVTSTAATVKDQIQGVLTNAETMDVDGLKTLSDAYTTKEKAADTARSTNTTEAANWTAAIASNNSNNIGSITINFTLICDSDLVFKFNYDFVYLTLL